MIDKEKNPSPRRGTRENPQVMFTPWLSDFNFRNWMDRTGIFNTKRIEKRWRRIRKSGKGTREGPLLPQVVILLSRRPGWESDRQPTCSHKIPALPFKGLCDPNSLLNSPFLHNWPISLILNLVWGLSETHFLSWPSHVVELDCSDYLELLP